MDKVINPSYATEIRPTFRQSLYVDAGLIEDLAPVWPVDAHHAALVVDRGVFMLHRERLRRMLESVVERVTVLPFEPGEGSKTQKTAFDLMERLFKAGVHRTDVVVGFGGGVATDLAGFIAATCLRGLRLIHVPTSLLGAVDAAVGGKTAVNTRFGKNLLGAFHFAEAVVVEPEFLRTLPREEVQNGLAEMAKMGVVSEPAILEAMTDHAGDLAAGALPPMELVELAARAKLELVSRDPHEAGERRVLNFGHTIGHALEAASGFRLAHGRAVAIGMAVEGRIACQLTGFPQAHFDRMGRILRSMELPVRPTCTPEDAANWMARDKKNTRGVVRMALPQRLGRMSPALGKWVLDVPPSLIRSCWDG
jgi:3-dehydroquinate synthase